MSKFLNWFTTFLLIMMFSSCNDKKEKLSKPEVKVETRHNGEKIKNLPEDHNIFTDLENEWNSEIEKKYKNIIKNNLLHKGVKEEEATFMAECTISKMKEQNLKPNDVRDSKNAQKILTISVSCANEIQKKK